MEGKTKRFSIRLGKVFRFPATQTGELRGEPNKLFSKYIFTTVKPFQLHSPKPQPPPQKFTFQTQI